MDRVTVDPKTIARDLQAHCYQTKFRGERELPATCAASEGVDRIIRPGSRTPRIYALKLPEHIGEGQDELDIENKARDILSIKNSD